MANDTRNVPATFLTLHRVVLIVTAFALSGSCLTSPGYPDPAPDCMEMLGKRGVLALGTDSASMGPLPDLAEPTHYAGLKFGMIWTEGATNLGSLPSTGAFYCLLAPKHELGPYSEDGGRRVLGEC